MRYSFWLLLIATFFTLTPLHAQQAPAAPAPTGVEEADMPSTSPKAAKPRLKGFGLGDEIQVDLYTMGAGDQLFSAWGHAALCITDRFTPQGRCYNYGTTDFQDPWLMWNFLRGKALFYVSQGTLPRMLKTYAYFDRTVYRQRLPLSREKAAEAARILSTDVRPENRDYLYDHLLDNCSTRLRDHINLLTDGALEPTKTEVDRNFRDAIRPGFSRITPLIAASEILVGRSVDEPIHRWEQMFHPDILREEVDKKLGVKAEVVLTRDAPVPMGSVDAGQITLVVGGIAIALAILLLHKLGLSLGWVLIPLGLVYFTLGLAMDTLLLLSKIKALAYNEAFLMVLPTDLLLVFTRGKKLALYCKIRTLFIAITGLLVLLGVFIQPLGPGIVFYLLPMAALWYVGRQA